MRHKAAKLFYRSPLSFAYAQQLPRKRWRLWALQTNHTSIHRKERPHETRIRNLSHTCRANALRLRARRIRAADGNGHTNVNSHADIYTGYLIYATDNSANHPHNRSYTRSYAYSWPKGAGETVLA